MEDHGIGRLKWYILMYIFMCHRYSTYVNSLSWNTETCYIYTCDVHVPAE